MFVIIVQEANDIAKMSRKLGIMQTYDIKKPFFPLLAAVLRLTASLRALSALESFAKNLAVQQLTVQDEGNIHSVKHGDNQTTYNEPRLSLLKRNIFIYITQIVLVQMTCPEQF